MKVKWSAGKILQSQHIPDRIILIEKRFPMRLGPLYIFNNKIDYTIWLKNKKKINKICLIWFRINRKNSLKNIYISLTLVYPILSPYKLINSLTMKFWFFGKLKGVGKSYWTMSWISCYSRVEYALKFINW